MKISVILPIYNVEDYLEECINSILNQTMKEYEVILVNDRSTDKSEIIAKRYAEKHENIRLINHATNLKQGAARNTGLKVAKGKYVLFLDPDDIIDNRLFELCYQKAEINNLDFVSFGYKILFEDNLNSKEKKYHKGFVNDIISAEEIIEGKKLFTEEILEVGICGSIWREFYRRDFLIENQIRFREGLQYEDGDFYFETLMKAKRVMNIPEELYIYRKRLDSVTTRIVKLSDVEALEKMITRILDIINIEELKEYRFKSAIERFVNNFFFIEMHLFKVLDVSCNSEEEIKLINKSKYKFLRKYLYEYVDKFGMEFDEEDYIKIGQIVGKFQNDDMQNYKDVVFTINNRKKEVLSSLLDKAVILYNEFRKKIIMNIPFGDKSKVIGIYGLGNHTKSMIEFYTKNISQIKAQLIFIDSFKGYNNETIYGEKIINVNEINKYNLDYMVISSYSFEDEMYEKLEVILRKSIPIYRFYSNNNILLFE